MKQNYSSKRDIPTWMYKGAHCILQSKELEQSPESCHHNLSAPSMALMQQSKYEANGTGLLVFIDDLAAELSIRMNSEVYRTILSAHFQSIATKLIR